MKEIIEKTESEHSWSLREERAVLEQAFEHSSNPKKLKKFVANLYKKVTTDEARLICQDIYSSKDPVKYVKDSITRVRDFAILIEQFMEDGNHGAIITGSGGRDVYPIKVDALPQWLTGDDPWTQEDELEIMLKATRGWMQEYNKDYFYGKIVLFPYFGFSGIPRVYELTAK